VAKKIVLTTVGSLGDLHPFISIGLAMQKRGFRAVLAVEKTHEDKVAAAGLEAFAILPALEERGREFVSRAMHDWDFLIRQVLLRSLDESVRALDAVAEGAVAIVGSMFALAGPIIAEKRGLPFIPALLQPLAALSIRDPPRTPDYAMMARYPAKGIGLLWNRTWRWAIFAETQRRYSHQVNAVRSANGLKPAQRVPIVDVECPSGLRLALYSRLLGPDDPELPAETVFTGFPVFDSETGEAGTLDNETAAFLDQGGPPIVFTLGSVAVHAPGGFYADSLQAARSLNARAILLTGGGAALPPTPDVLVRPYLPHSLIFSHASAIVHHGGIGTTGQALLAGKPQIVVPFLFDQWDNASRVARLGVGLVLPSNRYSAERAQMSLSAIQVNRAICALAVNVAQQMRAEGGAEAAADAIAKLIQ
jgi:rhamnosyltransferase subunit B